MPSEDPLLDRLYLMRAEVNRVKRSCRVLGQMVAREIEATETTNDSSEEHTNDRNRSTAD